MQRTALRGFREMLTFAIGGIKNHEVYFEHLRPNEAILWYAMRYWRRRGIQACAKSQPVRSQTFASVIDSAAVTPLAVIAACDHRPGRLLVRRSRNR